jgi:2-haloacid dehalogenase
VPAEAVVFDAHGTLLDVGSLITTCPELAPDPVACVALWRAKQLEYTPPRSQKARYVDFWQVTAAALVYTL